MAKSCYPVGEEVDLWVPMSKLTVAEASKRGYATGLSILQAVQKDWLTVEKSADGQLIVDTVDLEKLFGLPTGATKPEEPPAGQMPGQRAAGDPRSARTGRESMPEHGFESERENASNSAPASGAQNIDEDSAPRIATATVAVPPEPASMEQRDDRVALLAEIEQLKADLDHERRHVAALLDVLTRRVLPPPEPGSLDQALAGDTHADGALADDMPANDASADVADIVSEDMIGDTQADTKKATTEGVEPFPEPAEDAEIDLSYSLAPENDERALAPGDDGIAVPVFAADTNARLTALAVSQTSYDEGVPAAPKSGGLFWRLWLLMSLVWVGMIGAFYWFISNLPANLTTIGQWILGTLAMDAPAMVAASKALGHTARDTFGPPAMLLIAMLVLRWIYRQLRR